METQTKNEEDLLTNVLNAEPPIVKTELLTKKIVAIDRVKLYNKIRFVMSIFGVLFMLTHLFFKTFNGYVLLLDGLFFVVLGICFYIVHNETKYLKTKYGI